MNILITGLTGFVGGHLAERLLREGAHAIYGISRTHRLPQSLGHLADTVKLQAVDLLDLTALTQALTTIRPDWIFHLAGYASTGSSFREPEACWQANLDGTRRLYEAVVAAGIRPRILFASSGLVYGDPEPGTLAIDEHAMLRPASPYAASKAAADLLSYQATRHPGLDIVRVRFFNQIGPRQSAEFAVANFARQIAAIEKGHQPPVLETGDLSGYRDLTDVRDMSQAMIQVLEKAPAGEVYNAGCGQVHRIGDLLTGLLKQSTVKIEVREKPGTRKGDTAVSQANPGKLRALTGWTATTPLETTLNDILNDWRART